MGFLVEEKIENVCLEIKDKGEVGIVPYLEIGNIDIINKVYSFTDKSSVKGCKLAKRGDILISRVRPTRGAIVLIKEKELCVSNAFTILRPISPISSSILWYYLAWNKQYLSYLGENCSGTLYPTISDKTVVDYPFPIPPLNEQKLIVEMLDAILPKVNSTKAHLEKIPVLLKKFRQSVLAAACSGRLTEDWREAKDITLYGNDLLAEIRSRRQKQYENLCYQHEANGERKPKKPILEIQIETTEYFEIPLTWIECHIGDIGEVSNGATPSRPQKEFWNGDVPWVSSGLVQNNRIKAAEEYITKKGFDKSSVKLLPKGTVLIAMIAEGKTRGQSAILDIEATINQNIAGIVIDHGLIVSEFLQLWFILNYNKNRNVGSGTGPQALNCDRVRELPFVLPPIEEQHEIVRRVEKLFTFADSLEIKYNKAIERVEKIDQSILAKAFRGELVEPDPNDEPAEDLLKRILEEKAKLEGGKKARKKK